MGIVQILNGYRVCKRVRPLLGSNPFKAVLLLQKCNGLRSSCPGVTSQRVSNIVCTLPLGGSEQIREEGADHSYWWNAALRESSPVKPLAFEEGLVGTRVWLTRPTSAGLTGQGRITR